MENFPVALDSGICLYEAPVFECLQSVQLNPSLEKSSTTNVKARPYKCNFAACDSAFSKLHALRNHEKVHTQKPYMCDVPSCQKQFSLSGPFQRHKLTHNTERSFKCEFVDCNKVFANKSHLLRHSVRHSNVKSFRCEFEGCEKAFYALEELKVHVRLHTDQRPYKCQCGKSFASSSNFSTHKKIHTGAKPFECDFEGCCKSFSTSRFLKNHKWTHSSKKRYRCDQELCDRSFSRYGSLLDHKNRHVGIRRFKCAVENCEKSFFTSSALWTHKNVHSTSKPFQCLHCPFRSAYHTNLKVHTRHHEEQLLYPIACKMQDGGTQLWQEGDIKCSVRTKTERHMLYHIERNHTADGIAQKFNSENKLAEFFDSKNALYDRDWANRICFTTCKFIEGGHVSARPDFRLLQRSIELQVNFLVGNDEFEHRYYACDSQRVHNIVQALEQTKEFKNVPVVYIRFNPHHNWRNSVLFSHSLEKAHEILWQTIQSIRKEDIHPGLNLVYVHYDQKDGKLDIFENAEDNDYAELHKSCVIKLV